MAAPVTRAARQAGVPRNAPARRAAQTPARSPAPSRRRSQGRAAMSAPPNPVSTGKHAGSIGTLEAEFFACLVLIALTIFTDPNATSDYGSVMLAAMKRATMIIFLFFILALVSAAGTGAARVAKAFGALVIVGLILAQAESGLFTALDGFFKANWESSGASGSSSANASAGAATPVPGSSAAGTVVGAAEGIAQKLVTGGASAAGKSIDATSTGAPQVPGTSINSTITNDLLKIRQLPINEAKSAINWLKGLFG